MPLLRKAAILIAMPHHTRCAQPALRVWERGAGFVHGVRRLRPGRPPIAQVVAGCIALASLSACGLGDGFADVGGALVDPPDALFSQRPTQLLAGSFERAGIFASAEQGPHLVALTAEKEPHLIIQALPNGSPCDAGPAADFAQFTEVHADTLIVLARTEVDEKGRRDYHFYDTACQLVSPVIKSALDFGYDCLDGRCIQVFLQKDGTLIFLDISRAKREREIEQVVSYQKSGDHWILSKDGKLSTVRADQLQSTELYAEDVQVFSVGRSKAELYYQTDHGVVHRIGDEQVLIEDACLVPPKETSFFQVVQIPCGSEKQFIVTQYLSSDAHVHPLPPLDPVSSIGFLGFDWAIQTTKEPGAPFGYLRLPSFDISTKITEDLTVEPLLASVKTLLFSPQGEGFALADYDGTRGQIYRLTHNQKHSNYKVSALLSDARSLSTSQLCSDFMVEIDKGGQLSDLGCFAINDESYEAFAKKVISPSIPNSWISSSPLDSWIYTRPPRIRNISFTTQVKNDRASLEIVSYSEGTILSTSTPDVGQVVPQSSAMSVEPLAAFYVDTKNNTLSAYYPELDAHQQLAENVSNYVVMAYPTAAVLFIVKSGSKAGIWMSKAE